MRDERAEEGRGSAGGGLREEVLQAIVRAARATERDAPLDVGSDPPPPAGDDADDSGAGLRSAVVAYTRALRSGGLAPERALLAVKGLLREAGTGMDPSRRRAL